MSNTIVVQFKNGAEIDDIPAPPCYTPAFHIRVPEGCTFWFCLVDELPSGRLVYKETTRDDANRIWKEES